MDRKTYRTSCCPTGFQELTVQMIVDHPDGYRSVTAAVRDIARKPGCCLNSLWVRYKQAGRDAGREAGPTIAENAASRSWNARLGAAPGEQDSEEASAYFAQA